MRKKKKNFKVSFVLPCEAYGCACMNHLAVSLNAGEFE